MKTGDFEYELPEDRIAQKPARPRDSSRLMVLNRSRRCWREDRFYNFPEYLERGDCLVLNDTRVIPARLRGRKVGTGGRVEVVLLNRLGPERWEALVRPGRRIREGMELVFEGPGGSSLRAEVGEGTTYGGRILIFRNKERFRERLGRVGEMPLPPYIDRQPDDEEEYQTIYAQKEGSAAAPTAGFHFTEHVFERLGKRGVHLARLTLHIGLGTFRPVTRENVEEHTMHAEFYEVGDEAAETINGARRRGGRVIAVGTTSTRALESAADANGRIRPRRGWTDLFIVPGYEFRVLEGLVTNFHLPRSTLLMLVSAFAGRELVLDAYRDAIRRGFRFYSFGDAMFVH